MSSEKAKLHAKAYMEIYEGTPRGRKSSVHYNSTYRFEKAREQIAIKNVDIDVIIKHVNDFLSSLEISKTQNPIFYTSQNIDYSEIKKEYRLLDKRDIIWMKFTTDGYLGVVATSNDINFIIPENSEDYNKKTSRNLWQYNTSGILVHHVGKEWDASFVLIFPLCNIPEGYSRGSIERGVGNYLISKKVPIIDFYSHNY